VYGVSPHAPPTFLKKGWTKNFGKSFVLFFTSSYLLRLTSCFPLGRRPTPPLNPFLKKGVKNPKNFGMKELCFVWAFRFGGGFFPLRGKKPWGGFGGSKKEAWFHFLRR